jgi:pimeloyl-ACP methyl ester carboxylesterase
MKRLKLLALVSALLIFLVLQSCLQFRYSDKKQYRQLKQISSSCPVTLGYKMGEGRSIHFTYVGADSSKALAVFIHGSPGSSSSFIKFAQDTALLREYNVLLIDRPGFGYSTFGKAEPSIERQSAILRAVVAQFPSSKKILIGHSLGGAIIVRMAMDEPTEIEGLLILAGSVSAELEPESNWRKPMSKRALRWLLPKSFRVSNDEIIPAQAELKKMEPLWAKITCDVEIIQGGKDKLVPAGNANFAEKKLVNARSLQVYRMPNENHFFPFTQPQLVTEALMRF